MDNFTFLQQANETDIDFLRRTLQEHGYATGSVFDAQIEAAQRTPHSNVLQTTIQYLAYQA